ncbi:MAG: hypothetical protein G01um101456_184 [Parcubacteria group bacterium Gr01-1014_56]|nr:MAG: hypothetical protein G01um101456_184 [Parcubacteria group bacterium Gr01-1014_56]
MSAQNTAARTLPTKIFMTLRMFAVVFALLLVYAVMPAPAHAAALTDSQIHAVTGLLKSFNVDSETVGAIEAQLQGVVVVESATVKNRTTEAGAPRKPQQDTNSGGSGGFEKPQFPGASACGQLMRNLNRGDQGEEVKRLQEHLKQTGDFDHATSTGYFGEKTEMALKRLQAREGVASGGDPSTTGFGALGPKTRQILMARCKGALDLGPNASSTRPKDTYNPSNKPVCTLMASKQHIALGESVTLKWESKGATWASTMSGEKGEPNGSITLTPTETTTYLKLVYNATGTQSACTTTVEVGSTTPAATQKVVIVPTIIDLGRIFSLMGSGMASVMDGYLSLFGLSL